MRGKLFCVAVGTDVKSDDNCARRFRKQHVAFFDTADCGVDDIDIDFFVSEFCKRLFDSFNRALNVRLDDEFDGLEQELQAQGIEAPAAKVCADKYLVERIAAANSVYGSVVGRLQYWADMFVEKTGRQLNEDELARMAKKLAADSTTDFNKTIELELLASGRR